MSQQFKVKAEITVYNASSQEEAEHIIQDALKIVSFASFNYKGTKKTPLIIGGEVGGVMTYPLKGYGFPN